MSLERVQRISGPRSPVADALAADAVFAGLLDDLDVTLYVAFTPYPRQAASTPAAELLREADATMLERLRADRAYLVIDHSGEGHGHLPEYSSLLHDWCTDRLIPATRLVYVNANEAYARDYERWAAERQIGPRYVHVGFNAFAVAVGVAAARLETGTTEALLLHRNPRSYRFLCFNNAARAERIVAAAHLLAVQPPDALVSLGSRKGAADPTASLAEIESKYARASMLENHAADVKGVTYEDVVARTTLPAPDSAPGAPLAMRFDLEHYANSYMSVVTETEMTRGQVRRVTEKLVKPFLFGHVPIVAGNPGSLAIIRRMGFETYGNFIDESYDEIESPNERLCAVLCEVDRLRRLSSDEVHGALLALEDRRLANMRYGRQVLPHRLRHGLTRSMTELLFVGAGARASST